MNNELYDLFNAGGEIRIEIGGKDKYRYLTEEEIISLLDAMEAQSTIKEMEIMGRIQRKAA